MRAFHAATVALGVGDKVTDLHRLRFRPHADLQRQRLGPWLGPHHFVLGGAVQGPAFYGTPPVIANNGPDDVGQGRLLPRTSVDQYAATLASWFGVADADLTLVAPNLGNYTVKDLGFFA